MSAILDTSPCRKYNSGATAKIPVLGKPAADIPDMLMDAENLLHDQNVGNVLAPAGLAAYPGICPSEVGISTSPAVRPCVSVWIVCADTGWTASANPAESAVLTVALTNSRRV